MSDAELTQVLTWLWIVIAILFFVGEIFTAGFVLMCFGVGALLAAAAGFAGFGLVWQLAVFIVGSVIAVLLSRPFARQVSGAGEQPVAIGRVIGQQGLVLKEINPRTGTGLVRIGTEEWRAESATGEVIPAGATVEVLGVEGVRLRVRPVSPSASTGADVGAQT